MGGSYNGYVSRHVTKLIALDYSIVKVDNIE